MEYGVIDDEPILSSPDDYYYGAGTCDLSPNACRNTQTQGWLLKPTQIMSYIHITSVEVY